MNKFGGIARRFERKGVAFGKTVIVDYAHHPTEIAATLACARELFLTLKRNVIFAVVFALIVVAVAAFMIYTDLAI